MRNLIMVLVLGLMTIIPQSANASYSTSPLSKTELKFFKRQEAHLIEASKVSGIKVSVLAAIGQMESGLGQEVYNKRGSKATGVMQYTARTWRYDLKEHGKKVGLSKHASRLNDRANILLASVALKARKDYLREATGKNISDGDAYLTHLVGLGGTLKLIKGKQNAPVSRYITLHKGNGDVYYHNGKVATVAQFRANINAKVERESKRFRTAMVIQQQKQLDKLIAGILEQEKDSDLQLAMM